VRIHLARADVPLSRSCIPAWRALAQADNFGIHQLCDDPADADIVLFTEAHLLADWRLTEIRRSPLVDMYADKIFVYNERDRPWCAFPGIYVSMPRRRFSADWQQAVGYYTVPQPFEKLGAYSPPRDDPDLLFSFIGSHTHPCRGPLLSLRHPRAVVEQVDGFSFYDPRSRDFDSRRKRFAEVLYRSNFVLCPRGMGTTSIRLFETLAAGRVPVIVADDWVPPIGPCWDTFSVRWPEGETKRLVRTLEERECDARAMGEAAQAAFVQWFAPEVAFHRLAESLSILMTPRRYGFPKHGVRGRRYLEVGVAELVGASRVRAGRFRREVVRAIQRDTAL
jgi:hypothetical protein